jgi:hypothetical protein
MVVAGPHQRSPVSLSDLILLIQTQGGRNRNAFPGSSSIVASALTWKLVEHSLCSNGRLQCTRITQVGGSHTGINHRGLESYPQP